MHEITVVLIPKSEKRHIEGVEQIQLECALRRVVEQYGFNLKEVKIAKRTDK